VRGSRAATHSPTVRWPVGAAVITAEDERDPDHDGEAAQDGTW
jgi:hypothetical protein